MIVLLFFLNQIINATQINDNQNIKNHNMFCGGIPLSSGVCGTDCIFEITNGKLIINGTSTIELIDKWKTTMDES